MNSKLTLSINQLVIEEAKEYAKASGRSLSSIVEEYLKSLAQSEQSDKKKSKLKIVRELKGSVKLPKDFTSYEDILQDALIEKYLGE
ncbi:MAG: DUF6364 family protein [Tunicatimonas sp.]|uniref:DUF6364 family protein n=1 Tax=Tunicatimonas sp. TaxID=1940096 RepID=UPI003C7554AF